MIETRWKYAEESRTFQMDFSQWLNPDETIVGINSVSIVDKNTGLSNSGDPTVTTQYHDSFNVFVKIDGGTPNTIYTVTIDVTTSTNGDTLNGVGYLMVN